MRKCGVDSDMSLLNVENLKTIFYTPRGTSQAVNGISFHVNKGETLGLVGESGCGKSITALSIMRLIPSPPGKIIDGSVYFEEKDLLKITKEEMRRVRGNYISMIFQEPMTSLNPVLTVGNQISEAIMLHQRLSRRDARHKAIDTLEMVGIASPEKRIDYYPHQFSGGMRQRVMIAMALSCHPKLLIADEPTTALDVTIQAQILELMKQLQRDIGMAIIFISHNLLVIAEMSSRVAVIYAGNVVEEGDTEEIFSKPHHPYTTGLLNSLPKMVFRDSGMPKKFAEIPGVVPNPYSLPQGCSFHPRCSFLKEICRRKEPGLKEISSGHFSACWI